VASNQRVGSSNLSGRTININNLDCHGISVAASLWGISLGMSEKSGYDAFFLQHKGRSEEWSGSLHLSLNR
jgi:hypothetical protein